MTSDVLAVIDAAVGCQTCGAELGPDAPSSDFCGPDCQDTWHAARAAALVGYREPWITCDLPGVGTSAHVSAQWRLPRETGDLNADMRALAVAWRLASTPEQRAACSLRKESLRSRYMARCAERTHRAMAGMVDLGSALRANMAVVGEAFGRFAEGVREAVEAWQKLNTALTTPPPDPRERALQARRTRNTGPTSARRAPRTLGGRPHTIDRRPR